jgi:hypothetical protein
VGPGDVLADNGGEAGARPGGPLDQQRERSELDWGYVLRRGGPSLRRDRISTSSVVGKVAEPV